MSTIQGSYTRFIDTTVDDDLDEWLCSFSPRRDKTARALVNAWATDNSQESGLYRVRVVVNQTGRQWTSDTICVRHDDTVIDLASDTFEAGPDGIKWFRSESGEITLTIGQSSIMLANAIDEYGDPWMGFRWQSTVRGDTLDVGYGPTAEAMRTVLNSWMDSAGTP